MHVFDEVPLEERFYLVEGDSSLLREFTSYLLVRRAPSLVVDGGNSFSPFSVFDFCRALGVDAMERIFVSRATTVFQLHTLITESLPLFARTVPPSLILVSYFSDLFHTDDVEREVLHLLHARLLHSLKDMVRTYRAPVLVTEHGRAGVHAGLFDYRVLFRARGGALFLSINERRLRVPLIHPSQRTLACWGSDDG